MRYGENTQSYQLLELIAISGEFPASELKRVPGSSSYQQKIIAALKRDKMIRLYSRDGVRGYRLTGKAKQMLLAVNRSQFAFYLEGRSETNTLKSEMTRRLRLHRIAQTYLTMYLAGISIFRNQKKPLFSSDGQDPAPISPSFYSSREIKEKGQEFAQSRGTRSVGALFSSEQTFLVFNGDFKTSSYRVELRMKALLTHKICRKFLHQQNEISGLLLGENMELAHKILSESEGSQRNYLLLDGNFPHFYFATHDTFGETLLRLLVSAEKRQWLNQILLEDLSPPNLNLAIEHDGLDADGAPVLFAYDFDLPRLVRYRASIQLHSGTGSLICFDYQKEVLKKYFGDLVTIKTISFQKFKSIFDR